MTGNALCVIYALRSVPDAVLVGGARDSPLGVGPGRLRLVRHVRGATQHRAR
jgi:hypothetical protein